MSESLTSDDPYEKLEHARHKVAKWTRRYNKANSGTEMQSAMIRLRYWEEQEEYWFEQWSEFE